MIDILGKHKDKVDLLDDTTVSPVIHVFGQDSWIGLLREAAFHPNPKCR
jgi:hypothetical protein